MAHGGSSGELKSSGHVLDTVIDFICGSLGKKYKYLFVWVWAIWAHVYKRLAEIHSVNHGFLAYPVLLTPK